MRILGFAAEDDEFIFGCTEDEKSATHPSGYVQKTIGPGSLRGKRGGLVHDYPTKMVNTMFQSRFNCQGEDGEQEERKLRTKPKKDNAQEQDQ